MHITKNKHQKLTKTSDKNRNRSRGRQRRNRRYWKAEQAIMRAFSGAEHLPSAKELACAAKVSRSTFYRHHRGVHRVVPDLEKRLLADFSRQISKQQQVKGTKAPILFYRLLTYIYKDRRNLRLILRYGDGSVIDKMMASFLPRIVKSYKLPPKNLEVIRVYRGEITAVIETWISSDFAADEFRVLEDIMYLTRTARERLSALGK